ncbi:MAG: heavy metal translocating P-type ATPase [Gemmatimonadetes bacterium]|nr:heavy metal translocating P-type ATPase [Gemmatimonadota bacterium]MYG16400.1 heavy metal translocating P-type ATPase [Gemmatimonadota bacterium]
MSTSIQGTPNDVDTETRVFQVEGMTCSACSARVEKILAQVPGVAAAHVNLALERATLTVAPGVEEGALAGPVAAAGYRLNAIQDDRHEPEKNPGQSRRDRIAMVVAICLTIPFLLQMLAGLLRGWTGFDGHMPVYAEAMLATVLQIGVGARYYRSAFHALRGGSANMDVLVALGTTAAYAYSGYLAFRLGAAAAGLLYFEASAIIITLVLIGKHIETRARRSASRAIRELLAIRPVTARVRTADGTERDTPVHALKAGDVVICRPGDRVAADGVVLRGEAEIDEALITGESVPASKHPTDNVIAGSMNVNGFLEIEARAVGSDSTLGRVIRLVESAQAAKPAIQRMVDRVSAVFVPVVVGLAVITFTAWALSGAGLDSALINAVSVLVIACPCALGLATPTAIVAGAGVAARAGILIRDIESLEQSNDLTHVIFDKTGTLTEGRPVIAAVTPLAERDEGDLIRIATSLQQGSEHPFAAAFLRMATERYLALSDVRGFRSVVAKGVQGDIDGTRYLLGNRRLFEAYCPGITPPDVPDDGGFTAVWLAARTDAGCAFLARFDLIDALRSDAVEAVDGLRKLGVRILLVSGDAETVVERIGRQAGVDETHGAATPVEKERIVSRLAEGGAKVCMVGDGINDAPALARATVGIAMGSGTDVAMETAAITLMRPNPTLVAGAIDVSRKTIRKIKQNLFWAFIYNVIGLPLATLGFLVPAFAAAMMAASSISVVLNALTLRSWRPGTR